MGNALIPEVALEDWKKLLDAAVIFRRAEPWQWMDDGTPSSLVDREGKQWFAMVPGKSGEVFGLCLYRGMSGLRIMRGILSYSDMPDFSQWQHRQDAVTLWFGPKRDVHPSQVAAYRQLGYVPAKGDRLAWPDVRSHRPGFVAWVPDAGEVRALTDALPRVLAWAKSIGDDAEEIYAEHAPDELPVLPVEAARVDQVEWKRWATPAEEGGVPAAFDRADPQVAKALALPAGGPVFECDVRYMPEPVADDGDRPFYPRGILVVGADGYVWNVEMLKPDQDAAVEVARALAKAAITAGARPGSVAFCDAELWRRLAPWVSEAGSDPVMAAELPAMEECWVSLLEFSRRRRR